MTSYTVSSGVTSSGITLIAAGDLLTVLKGGTAVNTTVNSGGGVDDLGKTIGTVVNKYGFEEVLSGGVAIGTTVNMNNSGFGLDVAGGTASGTVLDAA